MSRIYSTEVELYDIAFGWDLSAEADWLVERLGPGCRTVLEPGCGTGRMLAALARRGLEVVGLDLSEAMVAWTARAWRELVAASPFTQVACFDGNLPERPQVEPEDGGGLLWHQLVAT